MLKDFFGGNQDLMNSTIKTSSTDGKSSKTTMTKKPQGGAAPAQGPKRMKTNSPRRPAPRKSPNRQNPKKLAWTI